MVRGSEVQRFNVQRLEVPTPVKYAPVKQGTKIGFTPVEHPAGTRFNGAGGVNFAVTIVPHLNGP